MDSIAVTEAQRANWLTVFQSYFRLADLAEIDEDCFLALRKTQKKSFVHRFPHRTLAAFAALLPSTAGKHKRSSKNEP
jgi:hypothetical protein